MIVKNTAEGKLILLNQALDNRSKVLYFFNFLLFFTNGTLILWLLLNGYFSPGWTIFLCAMGIASYVAAYRFINRVVSAESILLTPAALLFIKKSLLKNSVQSYALEKISNFRFLEKPELTDHPLAGKSMDYLGFQTEQVVINEMLGDNRLAFDYEGATISFGNDVYSWDFDEIQQLLIMNPRYVQKKE